MPLQMPPLSPSQGEPQIPEPEYPAASKTASGTISGIPTVVTHTSFSDKILITISQEGRLSQWIHVPLLSTSPTDPLTNITNPTTSANHSDALLPLPHLTPRTLLGSSTTERETIGQLYATQIASAILARNPDEGRSLLVGLGLGGRAWGLGAGAEGEGEEEGVKRREGFFDLVELVGVVL